MDIYNVSNKQYNMTTTTHLISKLIFKGVRQCGTLLTNIKQLNKVSTLHTY